MIVISSFISAYLYILILLIPNSNRLKFLLALASVIVCSSFSVNEQARGYIYVCGRVAVAEGAGLVGRVELPSNNANVDLDLDLLDHALHQSACQR